MSVQEKLYRADDLFALPDDGRQRELVRGEIVVMSPSGRQHGILSFHIAQLISENSDARQTGYITVEGTGYLLFRNPDTVRAPDVGYIDRKRGAGTGPYFSNAPDLAVEIVSPNDVAEDVQQKVNDYLLAGTVVVVVIYPKVREIVVRTHDLTVTLHQDDLLDLSVVLPNLKLLVRDIFATLDE